MSSFRKDVQISGNGKFPTKRFADFNGNWPAYKIYLKEHGLLSPNLTAPMLIESNGGRNEDHFHPNLANE